MLPNWNKMVTVFAVLLFAVGGLVALPTSVSAASPQLSGDAFYDTTGYLGLASREPSASCVIVMSR